MPTRKFAAAYAGSAYLDLYPKVPYSYRWCAVHNLEGTGLLYIPALRTSSYQGHPQSQSA